MGKFDLYKIQLKTLSQGTHTFDFDLDNLFFEKIDGQEVQKGKLKARVTVTTGITYELKFDINGIAVVSCDRCLDEMDMPISYEGDLFVKFGEDFSQENDDIVIVPEKEGEINIAWFLYEFVALSIPAKHIHPFGMCNRAMSSKLKEHLVTDNSSEDDEDEEFDADIEIEEENSKIDPRWDALKKIKDNDNNN